MLIEPKAARHLGPVHPAKGDQPPCLKRLESDVRYEPKRSHPFERRARGRKRPAEVEHPWRGYESERIDLQRLALCVEESKATHEEAEGPKLVHKVEIRQFTVHRAPLESAQVDIVFRFNPWHGRSRR